MSGKIKGITIEIGGDVTGLDKALSKSNKESGRLQSELTKVNRLLKFDPQNTALLAQKQEVLATQIGKTKEKLDALRQAEKQVQDQVAAGTISQEKYREFQREIIATEGKLKSLEKQSKESGTELSRTFENASVKAKAFGDSTTDAGKKMLPISGAVAALGVASGKMAIDFEDSIANINTLLDDDSNLKGYEKAVKSWSNETGLSVDLMSSGMYQAISSIGDGGEETEKIFGTMAKAAKAGGAEVSDSVSLISAGMKGYNQVNDETAKKISDLGFQTAKLGVTTFPEMAKSMQPLFPLANSLSMSYEELFGVMATGTGVTGNTSEVTTQFKAILSGLMKPTTAMTSLIEKYGFTNAQAMIESQGLTGVLEILQKETGGQSDKMATLFGSTEALTLATALTGSQFDTFKEKLGAMENAAGATDAAYDKLNTKGDSLRKTFNAAKNTAMEFGTVLMENLAPTIQAISEKVSEFSKWFSNLNGSAKSLIATLAAMIAVTGPLLIIIGSMARGAGVVMGVLGRLIPLLLGTAGNIGMLGKAIGILTKHPVVAIITGIVAAIMYLWTTNEGFRDAIIGAWTAIKDTVASMAGAIGDFFTVTIPAAFQTIIDFISNNWQGLLLLIVNPFAGAFKLLYDNCEGFRTKIQEIVGAVVGFFQTLPGRMATFFNELPARVGEALGSLVGTITLFGVNVLNWVTTTLPQIISNIVTFFMELPNKIGEVLSAAVTAISEWGQNIYNICSQTVSNAVNSIINFFASLPEKIQEFLALALSTIQSWGQNIVGWAFSTIPSIVNQVASFFEALPSKMLSIGKNIIKGLWDGISSGVEWLTKQVSSFCANFINGFKNKFKINSPSRVFADIGKFIMEGFGKGLKDSEIKPISVLGDMSEKALGVVQKDAKSYKDVGKLYVDEMTKGISEQTDKSKKAVENLINEQVKTLIAENPSAKAQYEAMGKETIVAYSKAIDDGKKKAIEQISETVTALTDEAQKKYDSLISQRDSMISKLSEFGELFSVDTESGEIQLSQINENVDALEKYEDIITRLKEKGVSDDFVSKVTSFGVEEGTKFAEKLLSLSDISLESYIGNWEAQQKKAREIAEKFYADELDALEKDFSRKLDAALAQVPTTVKGVGINAMNGFIDGMDGLKWKAVNKAKEIADAVIGEMQRAFDIHSPSRVMSNFIGGNVTKGLIEGLEKGIPAIQFATQKLSGVIMPSRTYSCEPAYASAVVDPVTNPVSVVQNFYGVSEKDTAFKTSRATTRALRTFGR